MLSLSCCEGQIQSCTVLSAAICGLYALVKATTDEMMSFWRRTCHGSNVKDSRKDRRQS